MEPIWLQRYPAGVPATVDLSEPPTLVALFETAVRRYAEQTAYRSFGARLSYRELDVLSARFAAWLQAQGVARGARVALMLPNLLQYPVCLFGALRAGCCVVNCNPLYTPRELEHQLSDAGAEVIVLVEHCAHTLQQVAAAARPRRVVVSALGDLLGPLRGTLTNVATRYLQKQVPAWSLPQAQRLSTLLAARGARFTPVAVAPQHLAFLQYTGGTTGIAKGAMLTHRNMIANVLQAQAWVGSQLQPGGERVVTALPLYHVFALMANCLLFLHLGAQNLLIANPRDLDGLVRALARERFTAISGVNTLFNALLNHPGFAQLDFSTLRLTLGGGMAVQGPVAERWQQLTGCALTQAYGLTEASPAVAINLPQAPRAASIGLPLPSTEISIRDEQGDELGVGAAGELCVRGPQVMAGYWQRLTETAQVMYADGFLRTGDVGYVDAEGFLYLVDRKKDLILVSGFNVYPNEVEEVVMSHPGVAEVAAVGVADERCGEAVKIFVVRRDPQLSAEALLQHCRERLTAYKVPRHIEFRDALPRSNVGKILRRALKEER